MGTRTIEGFVTAIMLAAPWCADAAAKVDFKQDVQPIFKANCYGCHGPSQQMNGFRLDRRADAFRGGTIVVISRGDSGASRMYQRLIGDKYGMQMPPTGPLNSEQIEIIKNWMDQGAEWPDEVSGEMPPPPPDAAATRIMTALRNGDRQSAWKAAAQNPKALNAKGPGGATPLMYAVLYSDAATVREFLAKGADPNIANDAHATALMWAAGDLEKARLLLDHHADPNAKSDAGRTALIIAAGRYGNGDTVKLLLDRGAKVNSDAAALFGRTTPLSEAAFTGDSAVQEMLLAHGADVKSAGPAPIMGALLTHCEKCIDMFLKPAPPELVTVAMTILAPPLNDGNHLPLLLQHGGDANAKDPSGNPLITLAASSDTISPDAIKMLIAKGADVNAKNADGMTALDLAKRRSNPEVVDVLRKAGAKESSAPFPAPQPKPAESPRAAVARSIPLLQKSDSIFLQKAGCVSCHNNTMTAMTVAAARKQRVPVDEQIASRQLKTIGVYMDSWRERVLQNIGIPGDADTVSYILVGMAAEKYPADAATDAMAAYLKGAQVPNGMWHALAHRPPLEGSNMVTTVYSIRALQAYAPKAQHAEYAKSIELAKQWVLREKPEDTQDRAFQLMALAWTDVDRARIQKAAAELIGMQRSDGGWSQIPRMSSDAYATGQALVALHESGAVPVTDAAYQRGVQFLLKSQMEDGSWYVASRAMPLQPYFESGLPHGHDQWISGCATNWATQALLAVTK